MFLENSVLKVGFLPILAKSRKKKEAIACVVQQIKEFTAEGLVFGVWLLVLVVVLGGFLTKPGTLMLGNLRCEFHYRNNLLQEIF